MTSETSKFISTLRLPLMIMVVFIHCYLIKDNSMSAVICTENIFSIIIPSIAVPLFMFFSGLLFFAKMEKFTWKFYGSQLRKRVHSLLIPYILWNTLVIIIFWSIHRYLPSLINPKFENISEFSPLELANCYWNGSGSFPIAYQFWFIRDLMVIILFTPIISCIYHILNRSSYVLPCILTIIYLLTKNTFIDMCYFFIIGGWCAVSGFDFIKKSRAIGAYSYIMLALTFAGMLMFEGTEIVRKLYIISGAISLFSLKFLTTDNKFTRIMERYSSSSFFIFAIHGIIALLSCKLIVSIISVDNQLIWISIYFLNILFIILFAISCYYILKRLMPGVLKIFTGNR